MTQNQEFGTKRKTTYHPVAIPSLALAGLSRVVVAVALAVEGSSLGLVEDIADHTVGVLRMVAEAHRTAVEEHHTAVEEEKAGLGKIFYRWAGVWRSVLLKTNEVQSRAKKKIKAETRLTGWPILFIENLLSYYVSHISRIRDRLRMDSLHLLILNPEATYTRMRYI
ncbi:hypothetical protein HK096_009087 [Nowakowskiella sp. JEL0078]|nr:hypothetical protein HK096_009087 [Nowakowskiella sp. JEL0078]